MAAGKTAKSILISCGARLAPFDIKELRDLMEYDELELDKIGDRKTALNRLPQFRREVKVTKPVERATAMSAAWDSSSCF